MKNIFFAACAILALAIPTVGTAQTYVFDRLIGSYGAGDGQFQYPRGVAADANDNIYVADSYSNRVEVFTADGKFIRNIGGASGSSSLFFPYGIDIDTSGNLYVADQDHSRIVEFTSDGTFVRSIDAGQLQYPNDVAVDSSGNLYIADTSNNRIAEFNSAGGLIKTINTGIYSELQGIALDGKGDIYVTSHFNMVEEYDSKGTRIGDIGAGGASRGIAFDRSGNLYVAGQNDVEEFDSEGNFVQSIGNYDFPGGQTFNPFYLAFDSNGSLYVSGFASYQVVKFNAVPEPGIAMFCIVAGMAGGVFCLRKRRK